MVCPDDDPRVRACRRESPVFCCSNAHAAGEDRVARIASRIWHTLIRCDVFPPFLFQVAEGTGGDDEEGDLELRIEAVESLIELMDKPSMPDVLVQCMAWILGEYGYLSETLTKEEIIDKLCTLTTKSFSDQATRGYVLSAIFKLVAQ